MSSHREAPEISKDPVADSTDTYAFVSTNPAEAGTVTLITNYIPLEDPAGGPNFYEFGDDVLYRINVDNNGDGWPDVMYEFTFPTESRQAQLPLQHRTDRNARQRQLEPPPVRRRSPRCAASTRTVLGEAAPARRATSGRARRPNYADLAAAATYDLGDGVTVLRRPAPRRLLRRPRVGVRPRRPAPVPGPPPDPAAGDRRRRGIQRAAGVQRPHDRHPGADRAAHRATARRRPIRWPPRPSSACGPRRTARRAAPRRGRRRPRRARTPRCRGSATRWSTRCSSRSTRRTRGTGHGRRDDAQFGKYVAEPELATLAAGALSRRVPEPRRARLPTGPTCLAILHTGIPSGLIPGFQNFTGTTQADMLRLNVAYPTERRSRTSTASSAATSPASRTAGGRSTTSSPSSCAPSPAPRYAAGRQHVHARRRRRGRSSTSSTPSCRRRQLPRHVPVPRPSGERLRRAFAVRGELAMGAPPRAHRHHDHHHHAGGGAAVLDIGENVGALVAMMARSAVAARSCSCARSTIPPRRCTPACGTCRRWTGRGCGGLSRAAPRHLSRARRARRRGQHGRGPRWQRGHRGPPRLTRLPQLHVPPRSGEDPGQTPTSISPDVGITRLVGELAFCCKVHLMIAVSRPRRIVLTTLSALCIAMAAGTGASATTDTTVPNSSGPPASGDDATYPITIAHKYGETTVEESPGADRRRRASRTGRPDRPRSRARRHDRVVRRARRRRVAVGGRRARGARCRGRPVVLGGVGGNQLREHHGPESRSHPRPSTPGSPSRTTAAALGHRPDGRAAGRVHRLRHPVGRVDVDGRPDRRQVGARLPPSSPTSRRSSPAASEAHPGVRRGHLR